MFFVHVLDTESGDAQSAYGRGTNRRWTVGKTISHIVAQLYAHIGTQDFVLDLFGDV